MSGFRYSSCATWRYIALFSIVVGYRLRVLSRARSKTTEEIYIFKGNGDIALLLPGRIFVGERVEMHGWNKRTGNYLHLEPGDLNCSENKLWTVFRSKVGNGDGIVIGRYVNLTKLSNPIRKVPDHARRRNNI